MQLKDSFNLILSYVYLLKMNLLFR